MNGKHSIKSYSYFFWLFLLCSVMYFFVFVSAHAATLFIYPQSKTYAVDDVFNVVVYVTSQDQAMNAVSGELVFPEDNLRIVSMSTSNSIIPFWIKNPTFSNSSMAFEGITPNPGFMGVSGKVINIVFKAGAPGVANVSFSRGAVLANDGEATNILDSLIGGTITIVASKEDIPDDEGDDEGDDDGGDEGDDQGDDEDTGPGDTTGGGAVPTTPKIISPTHPNESAWYKETTVVINWSTDDDIEATRLSITRNSLDNPDIEHEAIDTKEITALADGVWYAHVKLKNAVGWSQTAHFKIQIDTQAPLRLAMRRVATDEKLAVLSSDFMFDVYDEPSGIEYFEIIINETEPIIWYDDGSGIFHAPNLSMGEYVFMVKAFDHAGNSITLYKTFILTPFDPIGVGEQIYERKTSHIIGDLPLPVRPEIVSIVSYTGFGVGIGQVLVVAGGAASFIDIWLIILRFISFIASFFRRRKSEPWGVVYDSVTKQPLDPAYVILREGDKQKGVAITDLDGRYGFLVPPGRYVIEANKTHYKFPSEKLQGKTKDEFYDNLYFGEPINVDEGGAGIIRYNIPLDPVGFDWNEFAKKQGGIFRLHSRRKRILMLISNLIFFAGFALSIYIIWYQPTLLNFAIFAIYASIFIFQSLWKASHPITRIMSELAKEIVPFAVVKAYLAGNDVRVRTVVADDSGQFYLLTPPGKYYFTVEIKQPDGSYSKKYQTRSVGLKKGVVLKNIYVNKQDMPSDSGFDAGKTENEYSDRP